MNARTIAILAAVAWLAQMAALPEMPARHLEPGPTPAGRKNAPAPEANAAAVATGDDGDRGCGRACGRCGMTARRVTEGRPDLFKEAS